jgi:CBS domain-containing protein
MRKNNFARLPVLRDGKLVGIITRDDLLKKGYKVLHVAKWG